MIPEDHEDFLSVLIFKFFKFVLTSTSEKYELIRLVTDLLLSLYREGWEPMTPIDTAVDKEWILYFISILILL